MATKQKHQCRRVRRRILDPHWVKGALGQMLLAGVRRRLRCSTLLAAQLVRVVLATTVEALQRHQRVILLGLGVGRVAPGRPVTPPGHRWDPAMTFGSHHMTGRPVPRKPS